MHINTHPRSDHSNIHLPTTTLFKSEGVARERDADKGGREREWGRGFKKKQEQKQKREKATKSQGVKMLSVFLLFTHAQ